MNRKEVFQVKKYFIFALILILSACSTKHDVVKSASVYPVEVNKMAEGIEIDIVDLESLDSINIVVNKTHDLPSDYEPEDLILPEVSTTKKLYIREVIHEDLKEMFNDAEEADILLSITSGYRSYSYQKTLFNNYVAKDGIEAASRYSARPGQSEHQTGLALDLASQSGKCTLSTCFKDTDEGKWLNENAWRYGFILRYPEGKEEITGYMFEPWHFRYVGKNEAQKIQDSGLTIEEYYDTEK